MVGFPQVRVGEGVGNDIDFKRNPTGASVAREDLLSGLKIDGGQAPSRRRKGASSG